MLQDVVDHTPHNATSLRSPKARVMQIEVVKNMVFDPFLRLKNFFRPIEQPIQHESQYRQDLLITQLAKQLTPLGGVSGSRPVTDELAPTPERLRTEKFL